MIVIRQGRLERNKDTYDSRSIDGGKVDTREGVNEHAVGFRRSITSNTVGDLEVGIAAKKE